MNALSQLSQRMFRASAILPALKAGKRLTVKLDTCTDAELHTAYCPGNGAKYAVTIMRRGCTPAIIEFSSLKQALTRLDSLQRQNSR